MTLTNGELQEWLSRYPKDLPVAIAVTFNNNLSLFYEVAVEGIQSGDMKVVIVSSKDVDFEYETLMNGCDDIEENYS